MQPLETQMKATDLQPFCATDESRIALSQPFSRGVHTYATCGRLIVQVPRLADVTEAYGVDDKSLAAALTVADRPPLKIDDLTQWHPFPAFPYESFRAVCESCFDWGRIIDECLECKGTGVVIGNKFEHDAIRLGGRHIAPGLLVKLVKLPGIQFSVEVGGDYEAVYFRFYGGAGLVMPLRYLHANSKVLVAI